MGKSTISMAIFNCYVSSPEGKHLNFWKRSIHICQCRIWGEIVTLKNKYGAYLYLDEASRLSYQQGMVEVHHFPWDPSPEFIPITVCSHNRSTFDGETAGPLHWCGWTEWSWCHGALRSSNQRGGRCGPQMGPDWASIWSNGHPMVQKVRGSSFVSP